MAEPVRRGSQGASFFTPKYVDILHEHIQVHINSGFTEAQFDITYTIKTDRTGQSIPMMFYGYGMEDDFEIILNGQKIDQYRFIEHDKVASDTLFIDFKHYFEYDFYDENSTNVKIYDTYDGVHAHLYDLMYFEFGLDSGEHVMEVHYNTKPWREQINWVDKTGFYYSLDPAKNWRSFGELDIELFFEDGVTPIYTSIDSVQKIRTYPVKWHFDKIPTPYFEVSHTPQLDGLGKMLVRIGNYNIGIGIFILYILLLMYFIYRHRKRKGTERKFSFIALLGTVISPVAFLMAHYISFVLIEWSIGEDLTDFNTGKSYVLFALFVSFPWLVSCGIVSFLWDCYIRKKIIK